MKKTNNILFYLSVFTTIILVFFGSKIGNLYIIQVIACILAIFSTNIKNIKVKKDSLFWILAGLVTILTIFTSQNREVTILSAISIIMSIIIKIIYENHQGWQKNFIKIMTIASGIHVFATIIQLLFPNIITTINRVLLTTEGLEQNQIFCSAGVYAGLNDQTATNAYFIAIFIGIIFIKIITNKENKSINVTLLMIALVALFITAKRGILLFTLASMFFVFIYVLNKNKKDILKYLITLVIIVSVGYIAIINIPETQIIFDKFTRLENDDNLLNGRDYLWEQSLKVFSENKAIGAGIGYVDFLLGDSPHNIYLQLLAETGLFGFITYIITIIFSLLISFKKASIVLKQKDEDNKIYCGFSIFMQLLFIAYGFTGNPLFSNTFFIPYIISIAMINSITMKGSEEKDESRNNYIS